MRKILHIPTLLAMLAFMFITYGITKAAMEKSSGDWQSEYKIGADIIDKLVNIDLYTDETKENDFNSKTANKPKEAELHLRNAFDIAQDADADDASKADIVYDLAIAFIWQGRMEEARNLILAAKGIREKLHPGKSIATSDCNYLLASIYQTTHPQASDAEDKFIDVYEDYMALLPKDDARFARVLPVIGAYTKDTQEAAEYYGQYVAVQEKRFGKNSPKTVSAWEMFAAALANNHQHAQSAKAYEHAVEIRKANPGKNLSSNSEEFVISEQKKAKGELSDEADSTDKVIGKRRMRKLHPQSAIPENAQTQAPTLQEKYGLFDNKSMNDALKLAEDLSANDMSKARTEWTKVLHYMHDPKWFPSAALYPISLRFARLAQTCLKHNECTDADELMRASIEFPFHKKEDETQIDAIGLELLSYYKLHKELEQSDKFIEFASTHLDNTRRSIYEKMRSPEMLDD